MINIKNIEVFYLVDEVYKQKGKTIQLTIGSPIPYTSFTKKKTSQEWADEVKSHVFGLT